MLKKRNLREYEELSNPKKTKTEVTAVLETKQENKKTKSQDVVTKTEFKEDKKKSKPKDIESKVIEVKEEKKKSKSKDDVSISKEEKKKVEEPMEEEVSKPEKTIPKDNLKESQPMQKVVLTGDIFTVLVRNLPRNINESELGELFHCQSMRIPTFKNSTETKGIAFLDYQTAKEMNAALELDGHIFNGHKLGVEKSNKKPDQPKQQETQQVKEIVRSEKPKRVETKKVENFITICVRSLPRSTTEKDLIDFFGTTDVSLPKHKDSEEIRGFAFLNFTDQSQVNDALTKDKTVFGGNLISVEISNAVKKAPQQQSDSMEDPKEADIPAKKIAILNLSPECSNGELHEIFEKYGKIKEIIRPRDERTDRLKIFAFIKFGDIESAKAALVMDGADIRGMIIKVSIAEQRSGLKRSTEEVVRKIRANQTKIVHVGNVPFDITEDALKTHFGTCGDIDQVRIPIYEDSGKVRGFAYVEFLTDEAAKAALDLNDSEINGRKIKVQYTKLKQL